MAGLLITVVYLLGYVTASATEPCVDLDTDSCRLMAASRPDLCSDPKLSITACPAFCNLCQLDQTTTTTTTMSPTTMAPTTTTTMATTTTGVPVCEDVSTAACQLIHAQNPDMCSNPTLGHTCPRFCKQCPLSCYDCQTPVGAMSQCRTKMLCNLGEVCMRKEIRSTVDGHEEYTMSCARSEVCDGTDPQQLIVGRSIESRDLSITCCADDLCNNPAATTTTTTTTTPMPTTAPSDCKRDIFILLDESDSMMPHTFAVGRFLQNTVGQLSIGTNDALVSLATFSNRATERWAIDSFPVKTNLLNAIGNVRYHGGIGDVDAALTYVLNHAKDTGNRADAPDVVFLITDGPARSRILLNQLSQQVQRLSHDVIVLELNGSDLQVPVATDNYHHLLSRTNSLSNIEQRVAQLLCQG